MINKKGFTLAEMVAVIAILMLLAALSTPFVRGYIDDSYNGKAQIYMRQLHEARLNFEKDYPGTTIVDSNDNVTSCNIEDIYSGTNLQVKRKTLEACNYIKPAPADLTGRYTFALGSSAACSACTSGVVISMIGSNAKAGKYQNKCACMDNLGRLCKQPETGSDPICQ